MLRATLRKMQSALFENVNKAHIVTLNREKALNSLDVEMVELMLPVYRRFLSEPKESHLVIMKGAGKKAFCAGGDIVSIVKDQPKGCQKKFFYREYQLDYAVMTLPQPHVAFWDGIVMGGGVGISVHGSHRLTSEKATFAMPETHIGLFPDVGGSWFLPRLPHEGMGMYLALTGYRLKGADIVHAGIGTHYVTSSAMPECEKELLALDDPKRSKVDAIVEKYASKDLPEFSLKPHLSEIEDIFGRRADTVEDIIKNLQSAGSDWGKKTAENLLKASPSSCKISMELQHRGKATDEPRDIFTMEYFCSQRCMVTNDFKAGVTALLIDKTGNPKWLPATLEEMTPDLVEAHFQPASPDSVVWDPVAPFPDSKL